MTQTKGPVKRKSSFHFQLDLSFCGALRAFPRVFPQLWRRSLFTRIDPKCILELLVDVSAIIGQCISVIALGKAFV